MIRPNRQFSRCSHRLTGASIAALAVSCCSTFSSSFVFDLPTNYFIPCHSFDRKSFRGTRRYHAIDPAIQNLPRIYTSHALSNTTIVPLDDNQGNYLNVMRIHQAKRWGDLAGNIRLFNGKDGEWLAKLLVDNGSSGNNNKRRRRGMDASVVECSQLLRPQTLPAAGIDIHLWVGRLKKPRRKWMLEKVTELGINSIHVIDSEFSTSDLWEEEKHRLHVMEASEQCERMTLPSLTQGSWDDLLQEMKDTSKSTSIWLICRERSMESEPIWKSLQATMVDENESQRRPLHIMVGPEGGWSPRELEDFQALVSMQENVKFVSLGSLVLRAETAAITAVSAAMLSQES